MHIEVLPDNLKTLIAVPLPTGSFYLAGGTALALQLGHRVSIDLDWMNGEPIRPALFTEIEKIYSTKDLEVRVNSREELTFLVRGVKVTFLHFPFPLLFPTIDFGSMPLADLRDIAGMKAYAIGRRATYKDYIDLYFIVRHGFNLEQIISVSEKKFGSIFDPRLFLEQLIYFGDILDTNIQFLKESPKEDDVEKFFEQEVAKIKL